MKHYGYGDQDFIPCAICKGRAVDIHHIHGRGKNKDVIENLIALCRECHIKAHKNELSKEYLTKINQS
jgi:5-methylcytosine-specific restriction endonuclease McrA